MRAPHAHILLLASALSSTALAGPLTPPPGPLAPTMKTLQEVEPRTPVSAATTPGGATALYSISEPGSYYLTGDITGVPGKAAITISGAHVTLDLSGFKVSGGGDGIQVFGSGIYTIRNGVIANCTGAGIYWYNQYSRGTIEDVTVQGCTGDGFFLGIGETLRRCVSRGNGQAGFTGSIHMIYEDCSASQNTGNGFNITTYSRARNCTADTNGGNGFQTGSSTKLRACRATGNFNNGFQSSETALEDCTAAYNAAIGFVTGNSSALTGCTAQHNSTQGARAQGRNTFSSCVFSNHGAGFSGLWLEGANNFVENTELSSNGFGVFLDATATQNMVVGSRANNNPGGHFVIPPGNQSAPVIANPAAANYANVTAWTNISY